REVARVLFGGAALLGGFIVETLLLDREARGAHALADCRVGGRLLALFPRLGGLGVIVVGEIAIGERLPVVGIARIALGGGLPVHEALARIGVAPRHEDERLVELGVDAGG